jgi:dTDP-glucose 4,6-dehydratase
MRVVVTGGAGFIGSAFVRHMLREHADVEVVNLDKLTYAGNLENLHEVDQDPRYTFVRGDICDASAVHSVLAGADAVVNFAAETHVDRSISDPQDFIRTDVLGTHTLLETVRELDVPRYLQVSTDEVYGSIEEGSFTEDSPLDPSSPYSASKAGADLLVLATHRTYGAPVVITRSSNNYGPYQYPEKVVPLFVTNALDDLPLPLYGDGANVRDWLHVDDNCAAIELVLLKGEPGVVYNIGGGNEVANGDLTRRILAELGKDERLITPVPDRPGHDRRYSVDCARLRALGWRPRIAFDDGLRDTIAWYGEHRAWWERIKSGEWRAYYERQYKGLV